MMTRFCWQLADILSRILDADEREAILGDLAESGRTGSHALLNVLGLVVRRQAGFWNDWRPWLTLASLVVPLGMLLSVASRGAADGSAVYVWMYANNWEWGDLANVGFWHVFAETVALVFKGYLTLVCWSWTSGFVLGSISRRMIQTNSVLFFLMLWFGALVGAPRYFAYYFQYVHRTFGLPPLPDPNAPVFALAFYREMFPLVIQAVLVVGPSLWGMRQGAGMARLRPLLRKILWTAAIATLAAMVIQNPELWVFLRVYGRPGIWRVGQYGYYSLLCTGRLGIWSQARSGGAGTAEWPRFSSVRRAEKTH
jgi:hypothetical protein